jgi:hypothetical protein
MDERIEAFLLDVLEDEGESSNLVRENTRRYIATYEEMFRDEEVYDHKKDEAARRCRDWCRQRVLDELDQREGTSTADHLRMVLSVIEGDAPGPLRRYR